MYATHYVLLQVTSQKVRVYFTCAGFPLFLPVDKGLVSMQIGDITRFERYCFTFSEKCGIAWT
jgi:hypothetical protein